MWVNLRRFTAVTQNTAYCSCLAVLLLGNLEIHAGLIRAITVVMYSLSEQQIAVNYRYSRVSVTRLKPRASS